jgi:FAD/FMN-containing dehydrogenase
MNDQERRVISGWGRYPVREALLSHPATLDGGTLPAEGGVICRGQGRSYGDAAISSDGLVLVTTRSNRVIRFDPTTGVLAADAGLTIDDLLRQVVPLGWFPPVTPGTKHVSLGGAVAADVHGKNHHRDGSLGRHVIEMDVVLADGSRVRCAPDDDAELFWATVGGMGLTGMIATVTLQLVPIESSHIVAQHFKAPDLETACEWLSDREHDDQHTVAWMDCLQRGRHLGRSIVMRGHHARRDEARHARLAAPTRRSVQLPMDAPSFALNAFTVGMFNRLYHALQGRRTEPFLVDYDRFFYPLDVVADWNRLYGRRGFLQYQCLIPQRDGVEGLRRLLEHLSASPCRVFLAVLKRFGAGNPAPLSFPREGYTLALDLPMTGAETLRTLDAMDDIVLALGGRVYLAKDARLSPDRFRRMYPRLDDWLRIKRSVDPHGRFRSDLSRRLGLDIRHVVFW